MLLFFRNPQQWPFPVLYRTHNAAARGPTSSMTQNAELYQVTADLTVVDDTPQDVEQVWNGLWDIVYNNYLDHCGSAIRGFANFSYDTDGNCQAALTNQYLRQHGISPTKQIQLIEHSMRTPTLVTIGTLNRDFVSCILKNVFTALGNMCRGSRDVVVELGRLGTFIFHGKSRFYEFKLKPLTKIHPAFRAKDERLCEIYRNQDDYQQADPHKYTDKITWTSGVKLDIKPAPQFDLTMNSTYKGKTNTLRLNK